MNKYLHCRDTPESGISEPIRAADFDFLEIHDAGVVFETLGHDFFTYGFGNLAVVDDCFDFDVIEALYDGGLIGGGVEAVEAFSTCADESVALAVTGLDDGADSIGDEMLDDDDELGGFVKHGR